MMNLNVVTGDATQPQGAGPMIIAHICNDAGKWGAGFVVALSNRFPAAEEAYRMWVEQTDYGHLPRGEVQFVAVKDDLWVANMIGQVGRQTLKSIPPIRYYAVEKALETVGQRATDVNASVHMPRIGTGLGGGAWHRIEKIVRETLLQQRVPTFVYTLLGDEGIQ